MKAVLLLSAFTALALGNVHPFWAEHNFMCRTCKHTVDYIASGGEMRNFIGSLDGRGREYSTVFTKIRSSEQSIAYMSRAGHMKPAEICKELSLCDGAYVDPLGDRTIFDDAARIVNEVNSDPEATWTAAVPSKSFANRTWASFRRTLGGIVDTDHVYKLKVLPEPLAMDDEAPLDGFDVRTAWPMCSKISGHIRDQSSCGSCWAHGTTEALNDRLCIKTRGQFTQLLSTEDTTSCCTYGSDGCNGGSSGGAWQYFGDTGVPSGGGYADQGKTDTCQPYTLPKCAIWGTHEPDYPDCPKQQYPTPECMQSCRNTGYPKSFSNDKHYDQNGGYNLQSISSVQRDLKTYGSVAAAFTVYQDFPTYKHGVYQHMSGQALGGHIVKIIGWGTDNGTPYWLVANSWNEEWGDHGYFKILKGSDECGIEEDINAGRAQN